MKRCIQVKCHTVPSKDRFKKLRALKDTESDREFLQNRCKELNNRLRTRDEYIVDLLRKLHQLKPCMAEYNPGLYRVFCLVDSYNDGYVAVAYLVDGNGKVVHQRVIGNTSGRTVENYHMTDLWERLHYTGALIDYNLAREDGMKFIDQVLAKEDTKESDDSRRYAITYVRSPENRTHVTLYECDTPKFSVIYALDEDDRFIAYCVTRITYDNLDTLNDHDKIDWIKHVIMAHPEYRTRLIDPSVQITVGEINYVIPEILRARLAGRQPVMTDGTPIPVLSQVK